MGIIVRTLDLMSEADDDLYEYDIFRVSLDIPRCRLVLVIHSAKGLCSCSE